MSYRYTSNPDGSGTYTDLRSGKTFTHEGGKRGASSKTGAKQALLTHQAAMDRAEALRPKQKAPTLVDRIIYTPHAVKVSEQVEHIGRAPASAESGAQNRLDYLQKRLNSAATPEDRAKIERRIAAAQTAGERGGQKQAIRDTKAAEQADPRFLQTVDRAETLYRQMLERPDIDSGMLEAQRRAVLELKHSRDYTAYDQHEEQTRLRFEHQRDATVANMEAGLTLARQEIKAFKQQPALLPEGSADEAI